MFNIGRIYQRFLMKKDFPDLVRRASENLYRMRNEAEIDFMATRESEKEKKPTLH